MKKSFWIPAIVLYVVNVIFCDSVQVGTVLFTTTDLVRKCWTECDKSLLKARLIMQDVLPDPDCIDFSNPEAVAILLDYFHACFQIISTSTYGKIQNLMFLALSDALGGYLRAYVLPFTRRAYYAGQVKYSEAKKLFQLYDEIKTFLKTNGMGWAEPQKLNFKKIHVTPLAITGGALEACKLLFTIEKHRNFHCTNMNPFMENIDSYNSERAKKSRDTSREEDPGEVSHECSNPSQHLNSTFAPKFSRNSTGVSVSEDEIDKLDLLNHKNVSGGQKFLKQFFDVMFMNISEELEEKAETPERRKARCYCGCPKCNEFPYSCKRVVVPLPILDDSASPQSIAVPFKKQPLRNLKTQSSAFVLEYYYIAVIKCFIAKGNSRADIKNFNSKFYSWLFSEVYPRLSEEEWYPAFGGVLRIMETIKKFGMDKFAGDLTSQDIGYLFDSGVEFEDEGSKSREKARNVDVFDEECTYSKRHVLTSILLVSLIWIFVFCTCAFYFQARRGHSTFYEGQYSVESSRSRFKESQRKKDKFINFQFLIKFFKKKDESDYTMDTREVFWNVTRPKTKFPRDKNINSKHRPKDHSRKSKLPENEILIPYGFGDFPALDTPVLKKDFKSGISSWPCQPCLVPLEKLELLKVEKSSAEGFKTAKDQRRGIETLWKKPSKKFKQNAALKEGRERKLPKEKSELTSTSTTASERFEKTSPETYSASADETKTTEKDSSSCCCSSESCHHSPSTTTNTSDTRVQPSPPKSRRLLPPTRQAHRLKRN